MQSSSASQGSWPGFALKRIAEAAGPTGQSTTLPVSGAVMPLREHCSALACSLPLAAPLPPAGRPRADNPGHARGNASQRLWFLMLMAAMTTIFIWLYVDAVRKICLKKAGDEPEDAEPAGWILRRESGLGRVQPHSGLHCRRPFGLFRAPSLRPCGRSFPDPGGPAAACIPLSGSIIPGVLPPAFHSCAGWRPAPGLGTAFAAAAFSVCIIPGRSPGQFLPFPDWPHRLCRFHLFNQLHSFRAPGLVLVFLLLTFGSLAGIVPQTMWASMFAYWELMTFCLIFPGCL